MASDPFREPDVQVGIVWRKSADVFGPFIVERPDAVEFANELKSRPAGNGHYTTTLKHRSGVLVVDLNEVAGISVLSGTVERVKELVDLIC